MKSDRKKAPSDYPIFSFRISEAEKESLNKTIDKVIKLLNKELSPDQKAIKKNDVIVEALKIGLSQLSSKKNK